VRQCEEDRSAEWELRLQRSFDSKRSSPARLLRGRVVGFKTNHPEIDFIGDQSPKDYLEYCRLALQRDEENVALVRQVVDQRGTVHRITHMPMDIDAEMARTRLRMRTTSDVLQDPALAADLVYKDQPAWDETQFVFDLVGGLEKACAAEAAIRSGNRPAAVSLASEAVEIAQRLDHVHQAFLEQSEAFLREVKMLNTRRSSGRRTGSGKVQARRPSIIAYVKAHPEHETETDLRLAGLVAQHVAELGDADLKAVASSIKWLGSHKQIPPAAKPPTKRKPRKVG
jgi:hypothetical protein